MKFVKVCDIKIYMKSGNVIVVDSIDSDVTFFSGSSNVSKISNYKQHRAKNFVMLGVLDLAQIEAVSTSKHRWKFVW